MRYLKNLFWAFIVMGFTLLFASGIDSIIILMGLNPLIGVPLFVFLWLLIALFIDTFLEKRQS